MLGLTDRHTYYYYHTAADMRKGFDGLSGLVREQMGSDPLDGSVYMFVNKRRDRMKLLVWESGGFVLYYKRLERGTFELPKAKIASCKLQMNWETLVLMIQGIGLEKIVKKKRYKRQ
jgi:transposase